jgi:hypothetical protein
VQLAEDLESFAASLAARLAESVTAPARASGSPRRPAFCVIEKDTPGTAGLRIGVLAHRASPRPLRAVGGASAGSASATCQ